MTLTGKTRLGLFGGTFNPVHTGHLILAQCAYEAFELSRVLFIPSATPPHKDNGALLPAAHRVAMLENALEGDLRFEVCDIELQRGGTSYAIDTVKALAQRYPEAELAFIIGADSLLELHAWYRVEELLPLCRFVTLARPRHDLTALHPEDLQLPPPWGERLLRDVVVGCQVDISSTMIRHRVAEGMSIRYLVPPAVEMYITEHRLYG